MCIYAWVCRRLLWAITTKMPLFFAGKALACFHELCSLICINFPCLGTTWGGVHSVRVFASLAPQAIFHCSAVWGFFHCFESFEPFMPKLEQMRRYFCWNFWAAQTHSAQFLGSFALLTMAIYNPKVSLLLN